MKNRKLVSHSISGSLLIVAALISVAPDATSGSLSHADYHDISVTGAGPNDWAETFDNPALPGWTIQTDKSLNTYSIAGGDLRYNLDQPGHDSWPLYQTVNYGNGPQPPSVAIAREWEGADWAFHTQTTYDFTDVSQGRQAYLSIVWSADPQNHPTEQGGKRTYLQVQRDNDLDSDFRNTFGVSVQDALLDDPTTPNVDSVRSYVDLMFPVTVDTWDLYVSRHGQDISVQLSKNGGLTFDAFSTVTMTDPLPDKQTVVLEGSIFGFAPCVCPDSSIVGVDALTIVGVCLAGGLTMRRRKDHPAW